MKKGSGWKKNEHPIMENLNEIPTADVFIGIK